MVNERTQQPGSEERRTTTMALPSCKVGDRASLEGDDASKLFASFVTCSRIFPIDATCKLISNDVAETSIRKPTFVR